MGRDSATTAARAGQQYVLQATTVAVGVWQYDCIRLTKARKPAAGRQQPRLMVQALSNKPMKRTKAYQFFCEDCLEHRTG
jgi:hypothetical protein